MVGKIKKMAKEIKSRISSSQIKRKELRQELTFFPMEKKNGNIWLKEKFDIVRSAGF